MELLSVTDIAISLLTLTFLEIVLGVDNLIFISVMSSRLPVHQQKFARRFGLFLALGTRLILLASVVWIASLVDPLFSVFGYSFSGRDLFLLLGGIFLLYKATREIHFEVVGHEEVAKQSRFNGLIMIVVQIAVLDIVFSLDSVITAVGMVNQYWIMATAITIAIIAMMVASEPMSRLVNSHPTIKMLAFSFLLLVGVVLVADGLQFHIPRGYIYFALFFSVMVECLNTLLRRKKS